MTTPTDEQINREYHGIKAIYDIRTIIEDEPGKLMLDELVEAVRGLKQDADRLEAMPQQAADAARTVCRYVSFMFDLPPLCPTARSDIARIIASYVVPERPPS